MKSSPLPTQVRRAVLGTLCATLAGLAQADMLSITDASSRSVVETLNFYNNAAGSTPTVTEANVYVGSYQLSNGAWAFCLSPLTQSAVNTPYSFNPVTLTSFITSPSGYGAVFGGYGSVGPGYAAQNTSTVLTRIQALFNYAYADSQTSAAKSAAFAFAIWEIEGESVSPYSTSTGGLRSPDASLGTYLNALNTGNWGSLAFQAYDFKVYQADPITSSQSFLTVAAISGSKNSGATVPNSDPVPEPSTPLLVAAGALAWLGAQRLGRRPAPSAA
jgi:hypothetical protein